MLLYRVFRCVRWMQLIRMEMRRSSSGESDNAVRKMREREKKKELCMKIDNPLAIGTSAGIC